MKTNEAPEKIYVEIRHPFGNEFTEMLGFEHRGNSEDIEYTRADAFIEKACEWIRDNYLKYPNEDCADTKEFVMDFRKYMKGE